MTRQIQNDWKSFKTIKNNSKEKQQTLKFVNLKLLNAFAQNVVANCIPVNQLIY